MTHETTSQIIVEREPQKRYLLSPVPAPARLDLIHIVEHPNQFRREWSRHFQAANVVALDFETNGLDFSAPDFTAVGCGLSTGTLSVYVDLRSSSPAHKKKFLLSLGRLPLIGHNIYFDGGTFYRETGFHANWQWCTAGLFKQLSSESQELRWGLKDAQKELLLWSETNETELDQWLVNNSHHQENPFKTQLPHTYLKANSDRYYRPLKGKMYLAPLDILGKYCALDAQSTWQLFTKVLEPSLNQYSPQILKEYHQKDFITEVEFLIEQQIIGITVDKERLIKYEKELTGKIAAVKGEFYSHPEVSPHIAHYNQIQLEAIQNIEPNKYITRPTLGNEPERTTKSGKASKNWDRWNERRIQLDQWETNPDNISKNWLNWTKRSEEASLTQHFNIKSGPQLCWLYYEQIGNPIKVTTESGKAAIDEDALKSFGESGKILIHYGALEKEHSYVQACIEHLRLDSNGHYRIHPQFKIPGTLTGRLAGAGGLNLQQLPKSAEYLACWRPLTKEHIWVDFDIIGAEAVVAAELTRDPAMMAIYGPNAVKNDIYLFFGSQIPGIGDQIRKAGYDPLNPSPEGLAKAKKECKLLRNICKTVVLAKQYGAGANKIYQTLQLQGMNISFNEVKAISDGYDQTFSVLKQFSRHLEDKWKANKGYVLNGIGRPITVSEHYLKDLTNRVMQSTGHDIHVKCIRIFRDIMKKYNIWFQWIICDFHDQAIIECKIDDAERIKYLISSEVVDKLNAELQGLIPIKYDPQIISCLAAAKVEGYSE